MTKRKLDCCDYACYEDENCMCEPCKSTKLATILLAARDISQPTYVDDIIAHIPLYKLETLRAALRAYGFEEIECPCCREWFTPCNDVNHTNELHMCAFCATGQHTMDAPCSPI